MPFSAPLAILLISYGLVWATPLADFRPAEAGVTLADVVVNVGTGFFVSALYSLAEEIGWRGYMLPRLAAIGLVPAMPVVGFFHGLWHMPILLFTPYYHAGANVLIVAPLFLVTLALAGVFYGYLRLWTGSVWPVAIAHASVNMSWNVLNQMTNASAAPEALEYIAGESGILMILGLGIFALFIVRRMRTTGFAAAA